jgi:hypothetical protein
MTAIARAEALFNEERPDEIFLERVILFLKFGFVVNMPNLFVMFRPVRRDGSIEEIADPEHVFEKPDAWYFDLAVADLKHLPQLIPFPLPYLCFYRKWQNVVKIYRAKSIIERIHRLCST